MDPTVRTLRLLALLQTRPSWTAQDLATRLGVTDRTVRRDVVRLRDLGYTVDADPGPLGGYRLAGGRALPPLVLGDDEAVAIAIGLRAAAAGGVAGLEDAAVTALAKLEQVLPSTLRSRVTALAAATEALVPAGEARVDPDVLAQLAQACRRSERLRIAYRDRAGRDSRRDVDPHRLVQTGRRWYLVARDVRRDAWRTLRVDRVAAVAATGVLVDLTDAPDAAALVAESVALRPYTHEARVRLLVPMRVAAAIVAPTVGILTDEGDTTLLRLGVDDLDWLARYLVGLTLPLEVLEPPEARAALHDLGRWLLAEGPGAVLT
jgi:predicted DNA-binding transcriptional regulator YafY